jgi:hypothetical protein
MKKVIVLTIVLLALASSFALAETWNGLQVNTSTSSTSSPIYNASIPEYYTGPGYYSGTIRQYANIDSSGFGIANQLINGGGSVYYSLPKITITSGANNTPWTSSAVMYGVCIDTNEYTGTPLQLRKGWEAQLDPLTAGDNANRMNGTVKDNLSWAHTTYLFNQYQSQLSTWWGDSALSSKQNAGAFQLAIWEVMSGDGSSAGADFTKGYFTADGSASTLKSTADTFVAAAYNSGFDAWLASGSSNSAMYLHDHQDFLVSAPAVPEFPAAALAPFGLAAFGFIKRKYAKK